MMSVTSPFSGLVAHFKKTWGCLTLFFVYIIRVSEINKPHSDLNTHPFSLPKKILDDVIILYHLQWVNILDSKVSGCPLANKHKLQRQLLASLDCQDSDLAKSLKMDGIV
jgi:hypothetical protein